MGRESRRDQRFRIQIPVTMMRGPRMFALQTEDVSRTGVFIRTDPNLRPQETVLVSGEVRFPGLYTIEHENETLSSIMQRAGGVLPTGYRGGARLIRNSQPVIADFDEILSE